MMRRVHRGNMSSDLTRMKMEGIRSRSMLCESEPDPKVRMNLRRYIANCLTDLARYHADQRRFLESLSYDWQVISRAFLWAEKLKASKNVLRTIAVAAGMHRPESSNSSVRASTK
jgi:hypothetical protein